MKLIPIINICIFTIILLIRLSAYSTEIISPLENISYTITVTKNFKTGEISLNYNRYIDQGKSALSIRGGSQNSNEFTLLTEDQDGNILQKESFGLEYQEPSNEEFNDALVSTSFLKTSKDSIDLEMRNFEKVKKIKLRKGLEVIYSLLFDQEEFKSINNFIEKPDVDVIEIIGKKTFCNKTEIKISSKTVFYIKEYASLYEQYRFVAVDETNQEFNIHAPFDFTDNSEKVLAINEESISSGPAFKVQIRRDPKIKKIRFYNKENIEAEFDVDLSKNQTFIWGNTWICLWNKFKNFISPTIYYNNSIKELEN